MIRFSFYFTTTQIRCLHIKNIKLFKLVKYGVFIVSGITTLLIKYIPLPTAKQILLRLILDSFKFEGEFLIWT